MDSFVSQAESVNYLVPESQHRKELLEALGGLVSYQHYYRSVYGRFTQFIHRIGYPLPLNVRELYEIRVSEATQDRLLITAFSELNGRTTDLVTVDQNYEVRANFPIPLPSAEFLKSKAQKHLRSLRETSLANPTRLIEEQAVFKGFFKFETRQDDQGSWSAFAVGLKQPVVGMQLEITAAEAAMQAPHLLGDVFFLGIAPLAQSLPQKTGQRPVGNVHMANGAAGTQQSRALTPTLSSDEMTLAQKIYYGEIGRHANNLAELSQFAHFAQFSKVHSNSVDSESGWVDVELDQPPHAARGLSSVPPDNASPGLEIEPISDSEAF